MFNHRNDAVNKIQKLICAIVLVFACLAVVWRPGKVWSNAQQLYEKWMILTMILEKVERFYVDEKNPDELLKDAIDGMLFGLDPHSVYLTPEQYRGYSQKYDGYFGFGLSYCRMDSVLVVTSLVENGPADVAGIRVGDRIVKIAGMRTSDIVSGSVERYLSERPDKVVSLVLQRPPQNERIALELVKRQIIEKSIPVNFMFGDGIGYIKLSYFSDSTPQELDAALMELTRAGMAQLVLDLRDNSGGAFSSGVAVADRFIPRGRMIVYTKGRAPHSSEQFVAILPETYVPLIVLVNESTASDAEIVSGALQDWDRGLIVGRRTYGKALVQTEYTFQDESVLLLTTARYYTPLGRLIQRDYEENEAPVANQKGAEPQKYKTAKGRIVYGGGGIQPDRVLKKADTVVPKALRPLYSAAENIFFNFADKYVISHPEALSAQDAESFVREFKISEEIWQQFKLYVRQTSASVTEATMESNASFLKNELKIEIAGRFWGDRGRFMAIILHDSEVQTCLSYFEEAKALLAN
ncbi:S41 family peptidase [candidate division KSB1 bacterium]|nr:S41 family peptidase [candidate division KSB1 bacterium]